MIKNQYIIYLFIVTLLFSSCGDSVQEIEWETGDPEITLNVEGFISTDFVHQKVMLKSTQDYFYNQPLPRVRNAQVRVTDGENEYTYYESGDVEGLYVSGDAFSGETEKSYTLIVDLETPLGGKSHFEAETFIYKNFDIQSIFASYIVYPLFPDSDSTLVLIGITTNDPYPQEDNYYYYKIYKGDSLVTDTINKYEIFSDEYQEDSNQHEYYTTRWYDFEVGDTIMLEVFSISKRYYRFLDGLFNIMYPSDPLGFSGAPARVDGNINDGEGFGYFYGTEIKRVKVVVDNNF